MGKVSGLVNAQHFLLWCTPQLLEIDSVTNRPYHRLYTIVSLLAPHCQRITIALPSTHEYIVAPGEVHCEDTKWKRVRNAILGYQKEDHKIAKDLAKNMMGRNAVVDSDAEDSDEGDEGDDDDEEEEEVEEEEEEEDEEEDDDSQKKRARVDLE